jgi:hypothetical protein
VDSPDTPTTTKKKKKEKKTKFIVTALRGGTPHKGSHQHSDPPNRPSHACIPTTSSVEAATLPSW